MNKISGILRIGIALSVLWLIFVYLGYEIWWLAFPYSFVKGFIARGVLPLVVFWGLVWVIAGFRNKDDETEDIEDNKQDK